jgi:flagellar motor switch protein FliG
MITEMDKSVDKEWLLKIENAQKQTALESKYRKVAKLLILIGEREAANILSLMEPEQVEALSKEIAATPGVTAIEAAKIMAEFQGIFSNSHQYSSTSYGGVDTARRILYGAFGREKGEHFLIKTVPEAAINPFTFLEDFSGEQLVMLIKAESPVVQALVLSRLSSKLCAEVLSHTDPLQRAEIVKRIAHLQKTSPEVLDRVAAVIQEKARHIEKQEENRIDGMGTLTAILKSSTGSYGDKLLNEIAFDDPDLSQTLKDKLHTFDDIIKADDRPIQEKLRALFDKDIVLLLKGKSPEFAEKILSNVSAQRRIQIREEEDILGPVPRVDVDRVSADFLAWFRVNREQGNIILSDDEDVVV